jgi:hypothetical protein
VSKLRPHKLLSNLHGMFFGNHGGRLAERSGSPTPRQ